MVGVKLVESKAQVNMTLSRIVTTQVILNLKPPKKYLSYLRVAIVYRINYFICLNITFSRSPCVKGLLK